MGGGSSRFEETDWDAATGELTSSDETMDGAPPTPEYGVYFIAKRALNQREYDVTDSDSNLLYSTRMIEGTLSWFDVLGPGIDDYKLRIQVDLSRRYWVIYRFHTPTYSGQFADMTATTRLRESRGDLQPCLYKKACLTVTWSRYHAIVNLYGPPPENDKKKTGEKVVEVDADGPSWATPAQMSTQQLAASAADAEALEEEPAVEESKEIDNVEKAAEESKKEASVDGADDTKVDDEDVVVSYQEGVEETKGEEHLEMLRDSPSLLDASPVRARAQTEPIVSCNQMSLEEQVDEALDQHPYRDFSHDGSSVPNFSLYSNAMEAKKKKPKSNMKKLTKWALDSTGANDPPPDPLEGYLELDHVILKCEEINSFMGQHQTMLVTDKEAKLLEQEELETAAHIGADAHNPDANYKHGIIPQFNQGDSPAGAERSTSDASSTNSKDSKSFPRMRKLGKWFKTQSQKVSETSADIATASCNGGSGNIAYEGVESSAYLEEDNQQAEEEVLDPLQQDKRRASSTTLNEDGNNDGEMKGPSSPLSSAWSGAQDTTNLKGSSGDFPNVTNQGSMDTSNSLSSSKTSSSKQPQLEPLVGFWNWDNTMRVHKMKMHVAEGSDLALHLVLAIVTNQLRYERNVVVSTV